MWQRDGWRSSAWEAVASLWCICTIQMDDCVPHARLRSVYSSNNVRLRSGMTPHFDAKTNFELHVAKTTLRQLIAHTPHLSEKLLIGNTNNPQSFSLRNFTFALTTRLFF